MASVLAVLARELSGLGVTWLVQSSVLLTLGLLAGRLLRRSGPAVQSGVYRTTLAAVLVCPFASAALYAVGFDGFSLRLSSEAILAQPQSIAPFALAKAKTTDPPVYSSAPLLAERAEAGRAISTPTAQVPTGPSATVAEPLALPSRSFFVTRVSGAAIGLAVWLLGSMCLALRLWLGQARMSILRASAVPAEPEAAALCRAVARQMNVDSPTVWRSPFLFSPCLDGLRRPAILLPDDVDKNLRETFIHELAHLARRDGLWNLLRRSATAALWGQPLLWVLSRRLEATAEEVCDDYVVHWGAERADYAGHLLELAGRALPPAAPASVGMISLRSMLARRVVRILDTSRVLSTRAGTRAVLAMLICGLAGTVCAGLAGVKGRAKSDDQTAARAEDTQVVQNDRAIRGQVVGPDGKPFSGATVILARWQRIENGIGDGYASQVKSEIFRETTGSDGRFVFAHEDNGEVIATAPGFGLGYLLKDQAIRLRAGDLPINGRLVDLEGRPVAGVRVALGQIWVPAPELSPEPAAPKKSGSPVLKTRVNSSARSSSDLISLVGRLGLQPEGLLPNPVVTDMDGRFRIDGLGRDVIAKITLTGPTIAHKTLKILTLPIDRIVDSSHDPSFAGFADPIVYGATCTILVEPTRPIEGFVRDLETKAPIPGAIVTAGALSGSTLTIEGIVSTETDAKGHYRLIGLPKEGAQGHKLSVYPPFDRPYFITRRVEAPARPGFDPNKFDIALKSAIWITGKVTDLVTGKPVSAAVDYFPMLTNSHAADYPNFDANIMMSIEVKTRYKTDAAGHFRIVGIPGDGVVTIHTDDKSYMGGVGAESIKGRTGQDQLLTYDRIFFKIYQALKEISAPEGSSSFACDLGVDPGGSLRLRLVDESGKPVTHAAAWGRNPEGSDDGDANLYSESIARIAGLEPGQSRTVLIKSHDRKIGAIFTIPPDGPRKDAELTVALHPCATIKGRLVDGNGKPVRGGIRVELTPASATMFRQMLVATAELDSEGQFTCDNIPPGGPYQIRAANRTSYDFGRRMEPETFKPLELAKDIKLEPHQSVDLGTVDVNTRKGIQIAPARTAASASVPIHGRIVNLEGQPIAGVSVNVTREMFPKSDDLTPWLNGIKSGEPPWIAARHIDHDRGARENSARQTKTTTAADGRFRLEDFAADQVVALELQGGPIAYTTIDVVTRQMAAIPAAGFPNIHGPGKESIYGAEFTYTAAPGRLIEGIVKDSKSGRGLADAEVRSYRFAGSDFVGTMTLKTKTDAQGRFRLSGMPKGKGNVIIIIPNDEQPYFMQEVDIPDPPGAETVPIELALQRGAWIEGKLTEKATRKPVAKAWLHYLPFLENRFAQQHAVFDRDGNTNGVGFQDRYTTKSDGSFKFVGLPGRAIVGAIVHDKQYLQGAGSEAIKGMSKAGHFETYQNPINPGKLWPTVMKEINPPADTEAVHVDLEVTTGPSVRLTVVDPDGKPIAGLKTHGRLGRSSYDRDEMSKPESEVTNLMPAEERIVLVRHEGRKLGKVVTLKKGDDASGPVIVELAPLATITGRVVDADGNAVAGAQVRPDVFPSGDFSLQLAQVVTNSDGRFRVPDVPTGCDYGLAVETNGPIKGRMFAYHSRAAVKPGETTDVGDIKFKRD